MLIQDPTFINSGHRKHPVYGCVFEDVVPDDVIGALERLRDHGETKFLVSAQAALKRQRNQKKSTEPIIARECDKEIQLAIDRLTS